MRLIDADALKKTYEGWIPQLQKPEDEGDKRGVKTCIIALDDAPTMDAELARRGEWIMIAELVTPYRAEIHERCSSCGEVVIRFGKQPAHKFCPNCGAKMDLEAKNEND